MDQQEPETVLQVYLKADEERMKGLSIKIYRTISRDPGAQAEFLARFMTDEDGNYLEEEDAFAILDELALEDMTAAYKELWAAMKDAAAPKKRKKRSTKARFSTSR
jgi:hypothetical protein